MSYREQKKKRWIQNSDRSEHAPRQCESSGIILIARNGKETAATRACINTNQAIALNRATDKARQHEQQILPKH